MTGATISRDNNADGIVDLRDGQELDRAHPGSAIDLPPTGRYVLECAVCAVAVSWPLSTEKRRRRTPDDLDPPTVGRLRDARRLDGRQVLVAAVESARLAAVTSLKQTRTCPNGHYIGTMRSEPHAAPWFMAYAADRVDWRRIDA